jgi:hypothetical protein
VRFNARENGQISPSTTVWASGGAGNRRHLASVLQEGRNRRIVTPVRESSGESRFHSIGFFGPGAQVNTPSVALQRATAT